MEREFNFKKKWGQNFLSDPNLLDAIVSDAGVTRESAVLEIGAGAGALTRALAARARCVLAYEIDESLRPALAVALLNADNVETVFMDFQRARLSEIEEKLGEYLVVANLPYYITTPVVLRFIEEARLCRGVTVMVQEEVAERFCAKANTSEYGAVTAAIARKGRAYITRRVPRSMFVPRPNVDSAVVRIDFSEGGFAVRSEQAYRLTVRCAFASRRKTLENNLIGTFSLSREQAKDALRAAGITEGVRGETLEPEQLGRLSDTLVELNIIKK